MTCSEKAAQWGVTTRAVTARCRNGRIPGEVKHRGSWLIPGSLPGAEIM